MERDDLCLTARKRTDRPPELGVIRRQLGQRWRVPERHPREGLRLNRATPEDRDRQVRDHPTNPEVRPGVGPDPIPVTVREKEGLLGEILGARSVPRQRVRESHHRLGSSRS